MTIFPALRAKLFPHLLDSGLGLRPNPVCDTFQPSHNTVPPFGLTDEPWHKEMRQVVLEVGTLAQSECKLNECSRWLNLFSLPIIHFLILQKEPLEWRQTFPTNWAGANQEVLPRVLSSGPFTSYLGLLVHSLWNMLGQKTLNFYWTRFISSFPSCTKLWRYCRDALGNYPHITFTDLQKWVKKK